MLDDRVARWDVKTDERGTVSEERKEKGLAQMLI